MKRMTMEMVDHKIDRIIDSPYDTEKMIRILLPVWNEDYEFSPCVRKHLHKRISRIFSMTNGNHKKPTIIGMTDCSYIEKWVYECGEEPTQEMIEGLKEYHRYDIPSSYYWDCTGCKFTSHMSTFYVNGKLLVYNFVGIDI